jgi:hypothetical protein
VGRSKKKFYLPEELGVDGRTILKWILSRITYVDWIQLAQDKWQAVTNTITNFWVPRNTGNFLAS